MGSVEEGCLEDSILSKNKVFKLLAGEASSSISAVLLKMKKALLFAKHLIIAVSM